MKRIQPRVLGKNNKKQGGFTLIELVIVIIIAGILGAAIVATYVDLTAEAEEANAEQTVAALNTGIATYVGKNNGVYPQGANVAAIQTTLLNAGNVGPIPSGASLDTNTLTVNGTEFVLVPKFDEGNGCVAGAGTNMCYIAAP